VTDKSAESREGLLMKEKILELVNKELKTAAWIDLIVMVVAVSVTLLFFGIAAGSAGSTSDP
jgi:hypothetical protein